MKLSILCQKILACFLSADERASAFASKLAPRIFGEAAQPPPATGALPREIRRFRDFVSMHLERAERLMRNEAPPAPGETESRKSNLQDSSAAAKKKPSGPLCPRSAFSRREAEILQKSVQLAAPGVGPRPREFICADLAQIEGFRRELEAMVRSGALPPKYVRHFLFLRERVFFFDSALRKMKAIFARGARGQAPARGSRKRSFEDFRRSFRKFS